MKALGFTVIFTATFMNKNSLDKFVNDEHGFQAVSFARALSLLKQRSNPLDILWVSRLSNMLYLKKVNILKNPIFSKVYDTVDLHGIRFQTESVFFKSIFLSWLAKRVLSKELDAASLADATVVVSDQEKIIFEKYTSRPILLVSNTHGIIPNYIPWNVRSGLVFVGNFRHTPNKAAIHWFLDEVWPILPEAVRSQGLNIVGEPSPRIPKKLADRDKVKTMGHVKNIGIVIQSSRVSIAPLHTGAGVKGKIGEALGLGVPVVTTSIGATGMGLTNNLNVFIADSPYEFAKALEELQTNQLKNETMASYGTSIIIEKFSATTTETNLKALMEVLGSRDRLN
jgi:glycosyltransferase involved in cell wall biosynthesis